MRTFLFCGEPLPAALAKKLRQRFPDAAILNTYGPTEATVATTWIEITDVVLAQHDPLPVGHAKPDCELLVTDGEICIVGDHVMRGYLNRADLNEQKLFVHADGRRGFRTGDLGQMEEGGLLFCRGRMDDQIKLNGYRIELAEIDEALHGLPGAEGGACAVLRRPDGTAVRLIGFVTGRRWQASSPPSWTRRRYRTGKICWPNACRPTWCRPSWWPARPCPCRTTTRSIARS